jgi:D-alanyl-D-alanine carboxypeptidase
MAALLATNSILMRNLITFLTIQLFIAASALAQDGECSSEYSALVISDHKNHVLFERRAEEKFYPASLTKLMTIYLVFEALEKRQLDLHRVLIVSERGEEISKVNKVNTMNLALGDKINVDDAIRATIVKSFNEAAVTLAEAVAKSEWQFARKMNEKAAELGMFNSSFRNASGLHAEGQYTTAYDFARLVLALKRDFPQYYHYFSLKSFSYNGRKYETHNHVLLEYNGAEGMKTGFTNASGFNLISVAKNHADDRVVSVLMGCPSVDRRDRFTKRLLDEGFSKIKNYSDRGEDSPEKTDFKKISINLRKKFDYQNQDLQKLHFLPTERLGFLE